MNIRFIILFLILVSCGNQPQSDTLEGEIFIKLIDVSSLYGASDEIKTEIDKNIREAHLKEADEISNYYKKLSEYGLLYSPHFKLKLKDGQIVDVFITEKEYFKLKPYLDNLNRDKEKIKLILKVVEKDERIYHSDKIISIEKTTGRTDWLK